MTVRVKLFGAEARAAGSREVSVTMTENSCAALRTSLAQNFPNLAPIIAKCRIAVNHEFVDSECALKETDEIALIGMVSGG